MNNLKRSAERLSAIWPGASLAEDLRAIAALKDTTVPVSKRVERAEQRRERVFEVTRRFGRSLSGTGPGNALNRREQLDELVVLLETIASVFGELVTQLSTDRKKLSRQLSRHLEWAISRELACMYEQVLVLGAAFVPWPDGLWIRVHGLAGTARRFSIEGLEPEKPLSRALGSLTVETLYARLLLFGLADPYQLSSVDVYRIEKWLTRREGYARIEFDQLPISESAIVFAIDSASDIPAQPVNDEAGATPPDAFLDTTRLIKSVRSRLSRLEKHPDEVDRELGCRNTAELLFLFRQLETRWAGSEQRKQDRTPADGDIEVLLSFESIVEAISPESDSAVMATLFTQMAAAYGDVDARSGALTPDAEKLMDAVSVDASAKGARIRLHDRIKGDLRIGDLIVWRPTGVDAEPWRIGIVRWIRQQASSLTDVGVLNVPGQPAIATLSMRHETASSTRDVTALSIMNAAGNQLLAIAADANDPSLQPLSISIGSTVYDISAQRQLMQTRQLRIFRMVVAPQEEPETHESDRRVQRKPLRARRGQIWSSAATDPVTEVE